MSKQDTINRCKSRDSFTVINNSLIEDERLDWKGLGLLVYLLSKPDHWKINAAHLAKVRKTGRDGIYSALRNICDAGYGEKHPNPHGGWEWKIREYAELMPNQEKPDTENPNTENPNTENPNTENPNTENPNTENPNTENPNTENPNTENPTLVNTDIQVNTELKVKTDLLVNKPVDNSKQLLSDFGITGDLAFEFIEHRKAKKGVISKTVLRLIKSEADKANISMSEAIETMLLRNWQGFKAEWLANKQQSNQSQPQSYSREVKYTPIGGATEKPIN
jgi:hypothetical protein